MDDWHICWCVHTCFLVQALKAPLMILAPCTRYGAGCLFALCKAAWQKNKKTCKRYRLMKHLQPDDRWTDTMWSHCTQQWTGDRDSVNGVTACLHQVSSQSSQVTQTASPHSLTLDQRNLSNVKGNFCVYTVQLDPWWPASVSLCTYTSADIWSHPALTTPWCHHIQVQCDVLYDQFRYKMCAPYKRYWEPASAWNCRRNRWTREAGFEFCFWKASKTVNEKKKNTSKYSIKQQITIKHITNIIYWNKKKKSICIFLRNVI